MATTSTNLEHNQLQHQAEKRTYPDINPVNIETEPTYAEERIEVAETLSWLLLETEQINAVLDEHMRIAIHACQYSDRLHVRRVGAVMLLEACVRNPDAVILALDRLRYTLEGDGA